MSEFKLRAASGSQEDPVHRRAEQEAPREEIPIPLTTEALVARGDSLQHLRLRLLCPSLDLLALLLRLRLLQLVALRINTSLEGE